MINLQEGEEYDWKGREVTTEQQSQMLFLVLKGGSMKNEDRGCLLIYS